MRALLQPTVAFAVAAHLCAGTAIAAGPPVTVFTLGDSYINSTFLTGADRFAPRLEAALAAAGYDATVSEIGFKQTSKLGSKWFASKAGKAFLAATDRRVLLLELGQNDCADVELDATEANLDNILANLAASRVPVLIVGTAAYDFCGANYVPAYARMFVDLAAKYGAPLYPDFKTGVTGHPDLIVASDGDHANAAGEAVVVANMLPMIEQLIDSLPGQ